MRPRPLLTVAGLLGSLALAPPAQAAAPTDSAARVTAESHAASNDALCAPLVLDQDYGFGTSAVYRRIPSVRDLENLRFVTGLRHVLVALPEWPATFEALQPLQQVGLPEGAEFVVVLSGWPPTREALQAWNYVHVPLRIILVVPGPPADRAQLLELNRLRPLERVIAEMEHPARSGFERLQRPLSFRVLMR